jgi:hypothetical protein
VGRCLEDPAPRPLDDGADLRLVKALEPVILRAVVLALRLSLLLLLGIRHRHLVLGLRQDEAHPLQPFRGSPFTETYKFLSQSFILRFQSAFFIWVSRMKLTKLIICTLILIPNFQNCFSTYPGTVTVLEVISTYLPVPDTKGAYKINWVKKTQIKSQPS